MLRLFDKDFFKSYRRNYSEIPESINNAVKKIIEDVKNYGDEALYRYTEQFDKVRLKSLKLDEEEIKQAKKIVNDKFKEIYEYFLEATENIRYFHQKQLQKGYEIKENEYKAGILVKPIEKAGFYIPGGRAFYPSTFIMNVIPAIIAGVKEIIVCSPPSNDGSLNPLLVSLADNFNIRNIYKVGGAQAIAAMAFGTKTIPSVYKITGPGNIYVAVAKKFVQGICGIDSIAGPSEVLIFADEFSNPEWVAYDLCAQAEHDPDTVCILISDSKTLIEKVNDKLKSIIERFERKDIIRESLQKNSMAINVDNIDEGFDILNRVAPEHAEFFIDKLDENYILEKVNNAGALFLNKWTPVAYGDYFSGTNHVLPTNGAAFFSSPLGVWDFQKRISYLSLNKEYNEKHCKKVAKMAEFENLIAHQKSIEIRNNVY